MNDHDIMYALDFVSFLDRKFNITLQDGATDTPIFKGTKQEVKKFLSEETVDYILCDTDSMYTYGINCTIYVEMYI